jgi:hypothetical protein
LNFPLLSPGYHKERWKCRNFESGDGEICSEDLNQLARGKVEGHHASQHAPNKSAYAMFTWNSLGIIDVPFAGNHF